MHRHTQRMSLVAMALLLAGCASVDIDQTIAGTNEATRTFTQAKVELSRTDAQRQARAALAGQLLDQPLGMDQAVQLALANSPNIQRKPETMASKSDAPA